MTKSTLAIQDRCVIEDAVIGTCQKVLDQVLQRRERHRKLQSQITALGCELGFESRKEYVLAHYQEDRVGVLDVVWLCKGVPMVALEIYSARRRKSLYKLLAIEAPLRFWVYYGGLDCQMVVGEIDPEHK